MKLLTYALAAILLFANTANAETETDTNKNVLDPYLIYYSDKADIKEFERYQLIVLDSKYHPPLEHLKERGKTLLGYISLGEVESERHYFEDIKKANLLIRENKNWPGSYFVELRDGLWAKKVVEEIIPEILHKGFDGIFIDTLDNPAELERENPTKYKDMTKAAVRLVKTIRLNYPQIKIMLNRGYEILPELASDIDMVLGESIYADYDFDNKKYQLVEESLYKQQVEILKKAKDMNPDLVVYTLDYWNKNDEKGIAQIYEEERKNGFIPYVSTIELDQIIPEPEK